MLRTRRSHRVPRAAAATAIAVLALVTACGEENDVAGSGSDRTAETSSTPVKESEWFARNFGTPLMAVSTAVQPRAVEQAHDQRGAALPQNRAPLEGPVMWQRVHCEALPFSSTDGPSRLRGNTLYAGFARTPLGAAMAAYHLRNFGGTATTTDAIPTIAAPRDRARIIPKLRLDETVIPDRAPDCLATSRKDGIRRPARWHTSQVSAEVYNVEFWFPPTTADSGYTIDVTVIWSDADWYLTEQSIGEIGYSGQQKQPVPREEPTGWPRW